MLILYEPVSLSVDTVPYLIYVPSVVAPKLPVPVTVAFQKHSPLPVTLIVPLLVTEPLIIAFDIKSNALTAKVAPLSISRGALNVS